jgi:DNA-binding SARP family transcriptional activator/tetratricopeptide (TPR) repeat protein
MGTAFAFRVLGPVEARRGDEILPVGAAKQRALLAALLVDANRIVPTAELVARLWGGAATDASRATLHSYVMRLRRLLEAAGGPAPVVTHPDGYSIEVAEDALDLLRFQSLLREAASPAAAADPRRRAQLLREALGLWSGEPLANVASEALHRYTVPIWTEQRLTALEQRVDADLAGGDAAELLAELHDLTARYPLRERFWTQRMLALYRSGRSAEALECYRALAAQLGEELGIDPGPEAQALHQAMLTNDPSLDGPAVQAGSGNGNGSAPTESGFVRRSDLPGDLPDFTGRDREISALLSGSDGPSETVVICAVDGMAGIGKTAMAVHAAHRLADRYPDGQLYLDLQAHTDGRRPTAPGEALTALLRAVGMPDEGIPEPVAERSALWRAQLAGRRVLLLLDNAADAAQIAPLLPGAPGCLALVTSRRRLADLDTARTVSLDVLPADDAVRLFAAAAGPGRAEAEPGAVREVVRACGYLPLAIRIAGARLRSRPAWSAADLAARLADERRRLAELAVGDRDVARAFALSYRQLSGPQQRLFRRCGLLPGPDFDPYVAAVAAGLDVPGTERELEHLLDMHLLQQTAAGRYRFHDLLRDHARATALREEPDGHARAALSRVFDYYLYVAEDAADLLSPGRAEPRCDPAAPPTAVPRLAGYEEALAWCETELANLVAVVEHAAGHGWDAVAWQLPRALWKFFYVRDYTQEWFGTNYLALEAARRLGDRWAEAESLMVLSSAYQCSSQYQKAIDNAELALALYRELGDEHGELSALSNRSMLSAHVNRFDEAIEGQRSVLQRIGGLTAERTHATALMKLGIVYAWSDRNEESAQAFLQSLERFRRLGDVRSEATILMNLGDVYTELGRPGVAIEYLRNAVALCARTGDRRVEAGCHLNLGMAYRGLHRYQESLDHLRRATVLLHQIGNLDDESTALIDLARTHHALGEYERAVELGERALRLSRDSENTRLPAAAHDGLAEAHAALHRLDEAEGHRRQAAVLRDLVRRQSVAETTH